MILKLYKHNLEDLRKYIERNRLILEKEYSANTLAEKMQDSDYTFLRSWSQILERAYSVAEEKAKNPKKYGNEL